MAQKEEVVECDHEGVQRAFVEMDREHAALRAHAVELERDGALLEERRGSLANAKAIAVAQNGTVEEAEWSGKWRRLSRARRA